ncbi:MAG: aldehyde dehydrogenase family protein, partial [Ornithinibacter sp.]
LAIDGCLWGGFGTSGQRCTAASRVVVHEAVYREFLDRFVARTRALRVGDGLDPETDMGPSISEGQLDTVRKYVEIGQKEGARLACGGRPLTSQAHARGYFHEPTIFADVAPAMRIAQEEIFGPVVSVLTFRTPAEAVAKANNTPYGLSAGVWTEKGSRILWMADQLRAGVVWANTFNKFDPTSPFGGYKESGYGREGGRHGLEAYVTTGAGK